MKTIPACILAFDSKTGLEVAKSYKNELLIDDDYTKPYFLISMWDNGDSSGFATEEEVISTIIESKEATEDEAFDVVIYDFLTGAKVDYSVEYKVTLT